jgi:hypothetical protein
MSSHLVELTANELNGSFALEGHSRLGQGTAVQNRFRSERDRGAGWDGALHNTAGAKGGGSAESPVDVLRFGSVLQDEIGVRSGNQGAAS